MNDRNLVAPPGFEPGSQDPESQMMDHYTTGLIDIQPNSVHKKTRLDIYLNFHHRNHHRPHPLRKKIRQYPL